MVAINTLTAIIEQATRLATHSWEQGTLAEALLEWHTPDLSVYGANPFPDGKLPSNFEIDSTQSLKYIQPIISLDGDTLVGGDGALGDPAALGVSALLIGQKDDAYAQAADRQYDHLLQGRTWDGAISQREDATELWADNMYMAPPFLAYHAVKNGDLEALRAAAKQPGLYAAKLAPDGGLWQHILGKEGDKQTPDDTGLWSTGNAWAAGGMARVLATIRGSPFANDLTSEQDELVRLIKGIIDGVRDAPLANDDQGANLVRNYIYQDQWWGEISGTSLLAATAFRMAKSHPDQFGSEYVDWANERRDVVWSHVGGDGIAAPAVNPLSWGDFNRFTSGSPEGQAFIITMEAAKRDLDGN